jgi:hypothetical protein
MYKNIDVDKLIEVLNIQSHSSDESRMTRYIVDRIANLLDKGQNIIAEIDDEGNIYITKGFSDIYPTIVSHIDTVHDVNMNVEVAYDDKGDLIAYDIFKNTQYGIGGDDKVGVYMCLEMLSRFDVIKVVFFSREEIGCKGSSACRMDFFQDSAFLIQCDRRGSEDFIKYGHGIQLFNEVFEEPLTPLLNKWGYKIEMGGQTDVVELKENGLKVACFNMSCGYYNPHQSTEYVKLTDVDNCAGLVIDIISEMSHTIYTHEFKKKPSGHSKYTVKDFDDFYAGRPVEKKTKNKNNANNNNNYSNNSNSNNKKRREEIIKHTGGAKTINVYENDVLISSNYYPANWSKMTRTEKRAYKAKKKIHLENLNDHFNTDPTPKLMLPQRCLPHPKSEWDQDAYNGWCDLI